MYIEQGILPSDSIVEPTSPYAGHIGLSCDVRLGQYFNNPHAYPELSNAVLHISSDTVERHIAELDTASESDRITTPTIRFEATHLNNMFPYGNGLLPPVGVAYAQGEHNAALSFHKLSKGHKPKTITAKVAVQIDCLQSTAALFADKSVEIEPALIDKVNDYAVSVHELQHVVDYNNRSIIQQEVGFLNRLDKQTLCGLAGVAMTTMCTIYTAAMSLPEASSSPVYNSFAAVGSFILGAASATAVSPKVWRYKDRKRQQVPFEVRAKQAEQRNMRLSESPFSLTFDRDEQLANNIS